MFKESPFWSNPAAERSRYQQRSILGSQVPSYPNRESASLQEARRGWGKGASPRGAPQPRRPGGGVVPQWVKEVTDLCRPVAAWSKRRRICRTELEATPLCRHQRRLQRGATQPGVGHSAAAGAGSSLPAPASADLRGGQYPHRVPERAAPGRICLPAARQARPRRAYTHARAHPHAHSSTHVWKAGPSRSVFEHLS